MRKTKEFNIINNRLQFRCPSCGARRNSAVPNIRRKNLRCYKCGEITKCQFNRRSDQRNFQSGKAVVTTRGGNELEVNLRDISMSGVGFEMRIGSPVRQLKVGQEISLRCNWNPHLLPQGKFVVQSIKGQRIGVRRIFR